LPLKHLLYTIIYYTQKVRGTYAPLTVQLNNVS